MERRDRHDELSECDGGVDILEHHEFQPEYLGAMAINAGDKNLVRDVVYRDGKEVRSLSEGNIQVGGFAESIFQTRPKLAKELLAFGLPMAPG